MVSCADVPSSGGRGLRDLRCHTLILIRLVAKLNFLIPTFCTTVFSFFVFNVQIFVFGEGGGSEVFNFSGELCLFSLVLLLLEINNGLKINKINKY